MTGTPSFYPGSGRSAASKRFPTPLSELFINFDGLVLYVRRLLRPVKIPSWVDRIKVVCVKGAVEVIPSHRHMTSITRSAMDRDI